MSDIRNGFETVLSDYIERFDCSDMRVTDNERFILEFGYKAGRAHDIDGLIAALKEYSFISSETGVECVSLERIRKRFGKG